MGARVHVSQTVFVWEFFKPSAQKKLRYSEIIFLETPGKGTPKWMVKIMENPIKMYDLGGGIPSPIFGNAKSSFVHFSSR